MGTAQVTQPADTPDGASGEVRSAQLSAMLADLARIEEIPVGAGWSPDLAPGGVLGRFRLSRELGRGGFGIVFEAEDADLGRAVAVKVLRPGTRVSGRGTEWLEREARAVARLNHPHIVTLHDFGQATAGPYLVFELLRGATLSERLRAGPLGLDEALRVGLAVTRALVHAHEGGVVHRDLKPANVHLGDDGAVKVLDFGLAHLFGQAATGGSGGTPAYMAPEQWTAAGGDARVDLFALGCLLHAALAGAPPYRAEKGWSEANEPGPTPRLPRRAAPRALRALVASLVERDPDRRPKDAREVRDVLLALERSRRTRGRRRVVGALAAVAAGALGLAGWLVATREPPEGERVAVVLGAMENAAHERALDAVPGLLAAALQPSPRVRVLPRPRLEHVSRDAGLGEPGRLDPERARELARVAGAPVVLLPSARRDGEAERVVVRVVEAETGRLLVEVSERVARPEALPAAVDRLSDAIRRGLDERRADRDVRRPVAEAVTASPEAARFYYEGIDCLERLSAAPGAYFTCVPVFERALAHDPSFPLAHLQLALMSMPLGATGDEARPHVQAALRGIDRLPAREAEMVRALDARLSGAREEALRLLERRVAEWPEDPEALASLANLHLDTQAWAPAAATLERLVSVVPAQEDPLVEWIGALGRMGRRDRLRELVAELAARPASAYRSKGLVHAQQWLGDHGGAVRAARQAVEERGPVERPLLRHALNGVGSWRELEEVARAEAPGSDEPVAGRHVAAALAAQGRVREALAIADRAAATAPEDRATGAGFIAASIAVGTGRAAEVSRRLVPLTRTPGWDPDPLQQLIVLLGDDGAAGRFASGARASGASQVEALRAWRAGRVDEATAALAAQERLDPLPVAGLPPALLRAEVGASVRDDAETLAAVERYRALPPKGFWRGWAFQRVRYLAAEAHARLGDRDAARRELDALLADYHRADPDLPLLAQARALRARLGATSR